MVPPNFEIGWYRNVVSSSLFFSWTIIDTDDAISEGFQKILSNFELLMNLGSFGQTMVDQSF